MKGCTTVVAGMVLFCTALALGQTSRAEREQPPAMRKYETPYYTMYTDLDQVHVREATIRMTRMAEEYYERTKSFSGKIRSRLPFLLFRSEALYHEAGGLPGTAGVFMGSSSQGYRLMALAGEDPDDRTWHTVQHEGFHQFAHAVIGGELPIWVNEGLAEYFGEGLFTGDGFVTGVVPAWRLQRVKATFAANRYLPIERMMLMSHRDWNTFMSATNYDQAWAMVHFLAHAEDGKYQQPFTKFMKLVGQGAPWARAWTESFGSPRGFEEKWRAYWTALPANPTDHLYARATLETLSSFLVRAHLEGQAFDDFDRFMEAAGRDELKVSKENWLPPNLLKDAVARQKKLRGEWRLDKAGAVPRLTYVMEDRTELVATVSVKGRTVEKISVMTDELPKVIIEARKLLADGKRSDARALLQEGMRRDPRSPAMNEARQVVAEIRQGAATPAP